MEKLLINLGGKEGDFNTYYWIDVNDIDKYNIKPNISKDMLDSNSIRLVSYED